MATDNYKMADVYSFGIIVAEIINEMKAYADSGLTVEEVVYMVGKGDTRRCHYCADLHPVRPLSYGQNHTSDQQNDVNPAVLRLMNDW